MGVDPHWEGPEDLDQTTVLELVSMLIAEIGKGHGNLPVHLRIGALRPRHALQGEIERDGELFVEYNDAEQPIVFVEG